MKHSLVLFAVLLVVWGVWSGHFEPLLIGLGLASCLLVVALTRRMGVVDEEGAPLRIVFRMVAYLPYLALEIVKSNLDVARRILSPSLPIRPEVFRVRTSQRSDLGRVIYANSITLTPGTVSMGIEGDEIEIHALTAEAAEGVRSGDMDRRVSRVEGRPG